MDKGTYNHGSISLGYETMIIGGYSNDGRLMFNWFDSFVVGYQKALPLFNYCNLFSDMETEIWNLTNEYHKLINPTLPYNAYGYGIGLYIVPFDFCTWDML